MRTDYIITTFAEDNIGMLYRILNVFARRMINIESLTVMESEEAGVSKITFVIKSTEEVVRRLIHQIDKQIGVSDTMYHANTSLMRQKISLYRMFTKTLTMNEETVTPIRRRAVNS